MQSMRFVLCLVVAIAILCTVTISTVSAGSSQQCQMKSSTIRCFDAQVAGRAYGPSGKTLAADMFDDDDLESGKRYRRKHKARKAGRRKGKAAAPFSGDEGCPSDSAACALRAMMPTEAQDGGGSGACFNTQMEVVPCGQPINLSCAYRCQAKFINKNVCTCDYVSTQVTLNFDNVARPADAPKSCPVSTELGVLPLDDARQIVRGVVDLCSQKGCYCNENGIGLSKLSAAVKNEISRSGLAGRMQMRKVNLN